MLSVVVVVFGLEHGAGVGVYLVLVLHTPDAEIYLVYGVAVVAIELYSHAAGVGLTDTGVGEGGGLGRGFAYDAAGGVLTASTLAGVEGFTLKLHNVPARGVNLVLVLGAAGHKLQLVDVAAVIALKLGL